jgi:hypothetical protein
VFRQNDFLLIFYVAACAAAWLQRSAVALACGSAGSTFLRGATGAYGSGQGLREVVYGNFAEAGVILLSDAFNFMRL